MIEEIGDFCSELELHPLENWEVLKEGGIHIHKSRTVKCVSGCISKGVGRGQSEGCRIDARVSVALDVGLRSAVRSGDMYKVRPLNGSIRLADVGLIEVQVDIVGCACLQIDDCVRLPST